MRFPRVRRIVSVKTEFANSISYRHGVVFCPERGSHISPRHPIQTQAYIAVGEREQCLTNVSKAVKTHGLLETMLQYETVSSLTFPFFLLHNTLFQTAIFLQSVLSILPLSFTRFFLGKEVNRWPSCCCFVCR